RPSGSLNTGVVRGRHARDEVRPTLLGSALRWLVALVPVVPVLTGVGLVGSGPASAAPSAQPAFTTVQAPGGAATAGQRVIALTFDDGPSPYTPAMLSVLEQYHVPATF